MSLLIEFLENGCNTLIAFLVVAFPWPKNCFRIKEILICPTGDRQNPVLRVLVRLLYEIVCDNILWHFLNFGYEELIFDIKYHFDLNVRKCNYRYYYSIFVIILISLSKHQSVSESVCLFPNSSKTANPSELKFWGMNPLWMSKVLG